MKISFSGITWSAGGRRILDNVSLTAESGRFTGIIGPNGSGKGTQGAIVKDKYHIPHIESGAIFREHIGGSTEEAQRDIADFVPNKIMDYINAGNTVDAVNFPNIRLPKQQNAHRFLHIHKNVPGIMANINQVLASFDMNIIGQYLSTDPEVGYVITDLDKEYNKEVIKALKSIEHTIKFRVLY